MIWATRPDIHVDRAATAWLITTRIDPEAEFVYVDDPADAPDGAIPFDMFGVDLGHHGRDVTFETVLRRYELTDPILERLGQIVHEADVEDDQFLAPEAAGLDAVLRGLSLVHNDETVRKLASEIFDGLYRYLTQQTIGHL